MIMVTVIIFIIVTVNVFVMVTGIVIVIVIASPQISSCSKTILRHVYLGKHIFTSIS